MNQKKTSYDKEILHELINIRDCLSDMREHDLFSFYSEPAWKQILRQIGLGMLFAMGTVLGLATISWLTYHYFRDSPILMEIVQKQLLRNFDLEKIKNEVRIRKEIPIKSGAINQTKSGAIDSITPEEKDREGNNY